MQPLPGAKTDDIPRNRFAALIPVYNHEQTVADVVQRTLKLDIPVVVVDDGSTDATFERIKGIKGARVLRHRFNRGKGAALMTGFAEVAKIADWAITLDADGQHDPEDAKTLIRAIPENQRPIVIGKRQGMLAPEVPWTSRFGREFSNFWVRMAGGPVVADSQSGFRAYPLPECLHLDVTPGGSNSRSKFWSRPSGMQIPVIEAPVSVSYRPGTRRISHFHPFFDFLRNMGLFSRSDHPSNSDPSVQGAESLDAYANMFYRSWLFLARVFGPWIFDLIAKGIAAGYFFFAPRRVTVSVRFYRALFPAACRGPILSGAPGNSIQNFTSVYLDRYLFNEVERYQLYR